MHSRDTAELGALIVLHTLKLLFDCILGACVDHLTFERCLFWCPSERHQSEIMTLIIHPSQKQYPTHHGQAKHFMAPEYRHQAAIFPTWAIQTLRDLPHRAWTKC